MKISIVVPAFNEEKLIEESLRSMQRAARVFADLKWESELIVCNNNSTDRTAELAAACGARVVFEPVNQIARARNTGAQAADGDWLIFVDADSRPSPELFAEVAEAIVAGKAVGGGCLVKMDSDSVAMSVLSLIWTTASRLKKWAAGSFIFCETRIFREIGGFSHEMFAAEEIDLSERLKEIARRDGRKMVILTRHPLLTSARKMHLYSGREHLRLIFRTILFPRRTLRNREECALWYDGRR